MEVKTWNTENESKSDRLRGRLLPLPIYCRESRPRNEAAYQ